MVDIANQIQLPDYAGAAQNVRGLVGLQGNLLQQQATRQQMNANIAASQAMQQSVDPATGQIDQARFAELMSQGPGAYNLPTYLKNATDLENAQLETQNKKFDVAQKQLNYWNGQLGALLSKGENVSTNDVVGSLSSALRMGMITPQQAQEYAQQIPEDQQGRANWVRQHWIGLQSAKDQIGLLTPNVQNVDAGGSVNIIPLNPMTGQVQGSITQVNKSLSPGEAAQRVPTFQDGQMGSVPLGSTVGGAKGGSGGFGGGQGAFLPTAPVLGAEKVAGAAADRYNSLLESAGSAPAAINGYDRALESLNAAEISGIAANAKLYLPTILQSVGLQDEGGAVQNFQSLKKYLANAGAQAASAAGYSGSDARLSSFTQGQPDPEKMNPAALREAINYVKALQTGVMAKNNAAQEWLEQNRGNTASLPKFETQWANAFNPDVMELRNMGPEEQAKYVQGLSAAKRKSLMESYKKMSNVGAF